LFRSAGDIRTNIARTGERYGTAGRQGRGNYGATSGIGLRTAEIFGAEGAKIVIAGRGARRARALAKKLGGACIFARLMSRLGSRWRADRPAVQKFGRIGLSVQQRRRPGARPRIEGLDVSVSDAAMATLVRSVMLGMKHAAPICAGGLRQHFNNGSIAGRLAGFRRRWCMARPSRGIHLTKCAGDGAWRIRHPGERISPGRDLTAFSARPLGLSVEAAEKTPDVMRRSTRPRSRFRAPAAGGHRLMPRCSRQRRIQFINDTIWWSMGHYRRPQLDSAAARAMSPTQRRSSGRR